MRQEAGQLAAVRASGLFSDLDEAQAQVVATLLRPFSAAEHETLFRAGAPVERLLLLRSGKAGISDPVLTSAGPGDTLGELALNGPTTHTATEDPGGSEHDLADELRLMVFPVVLGVGKRLFGETSDKKPLRLVDSKVVGDGVVILTYESGART
jgi:hypothetical protein